MINENRADMSTFLAEYNPLRWSQPDAPQTITPHGVYTATPGVKVEVAYATAPAKPSAAEARSLWDKRWGKRPTGVLLVIAYPAGNGTVEATVVGLRDAATFVTGLPLDQVERLVDQALDAPSTTSAEALLAPLFEEQDEDEVPGFANTGLFATHELLTNVPNRPDWTIAGKRAKSFRGHRGEDLVRALGWELSHHGIDVLLIKDGQGEAVAVFLEGAELFDRPATRFGAISPVQHAIAAARNARVRWVLAVQGTRVRLYTADPDTGIARKGSDTYTEIDLATIEDDYLGYATLLLTPEALCEGGTADEILSQSMDHAAALGERLRDRVYVDVVPDLATAVAQKLKATTETDLRDAYRITLVVLFRILFVAYAEDRGLLPYRTNDAYTRVSLKSHARAVAGVVSGETQPEFDPVATDAWDNLTHIWAGIYNGHREWGIPAYGGSLFDPADLTGATITTLSLRNAEIGPALVKLLVDTGRDATYGPVDFQTLSVREFGTIYEGLLESSLSIAPSDLTLDKNGAYVPAKPGDDIQVHAGEIYFHNASGQRKATGSYFTKQFAVEHLLETALDPTVDEHLARVANLLEAGDEAGAHETFWDLRVADISMGSGHFLVGAVDHIASAFTAFLTEHPIPGVMAELERLRTTAFGMLSETRHDDLPEIDQMSLVRRQVVKRCIYGIDINTVAVDLARLALWIHTFVPGLPMSSLDHGLVHGNSLTGVGTLQEAFDVFEPDSHGARSFLADDLEDVLTEAADTLRRVALTSEATAAETKEASHAYEDAVQQSEPAKAILDAAVAARLGLVSFDGILDIDAILRAGRRADVHDKFRELEALHFVHAFPEVFVPRDGREPGFDVILGNPPWEKIRHEPHQFWVVRDPGLRALKGKKRDERIKWLREVRPYDAMEEAVEASAREELKMLLSKSFTLQKSQHYDFAKVMAERFMSLTRSGGSVGVVLPQAMLVLGGWGPIRERMVKNHHLLTFPLRNRNEWLFDGIHQQMTVCLVTLTSGVGVTVHAAAESLTAFHTERRRAGLSMGVADLAELSDELNVPWFEHADDPGIFKSMAAHPHLSSGDGWVTATADSTRWDFSGSGKHKLHATEEHPPGAWRVTMTRHVDAYALTDDVEGRRVPKPADLVTAANGLTLRDGHAVLDETHPPLVFRFPTNNDNSRTLIATALPESGWLFSKGYAHGIRFLDPPSDTDVLALLGYLNSVPADWWARRFVDRHLGKRIIAGLPLPTWSEEQRQSVANTVATLLRRNGYTTLAGGRTLPHTVSERSDISLRAQIDALALQGLGLGTRNAEVMLEDFEETDEAVSSQQRFEIRQIVENR